MGRVFASITQDSFWLAPTTNLVATVTHSHVEKPLGGETIQTRPMRGLQNGFDAFLVDLRNIE